MRLLPKDRVLYEMLDEMAGLLSQASTSLADSVDGPAPAALDSLRDAERRADDLVTEITVHADRTLVPSIDREDVRALVHSMDAIVDQAEDVVEVMESHHMGKLDAPAQRVVRLLEQAGAQLSEAVQELETPRTILEHTREVYRLRDEANALLEEATAALFTGGVDPMEVVKQMSLYHTLERAVHLCTDTAATLERVAVKEN